MNFTSTSRTTGAPTSNFSEAKEVDLTDSDGHSQKFTLTPGDTKTITVNSNGLESSDGVGSISFETSISTKITIIVRLPNNGGGIKITKPDETVQSVTRKSGSELNGPADNTTFSNNIATITFDSADAGQWLIEYAATVKTQIQTVSIEEN